MQVGRAARFGTTFVEPDAVALLGPSLVARLARQTTPGFVTGIDLESAEERERIARRAARFGVTRETLEQPLEHVPIDIPGAIAPAPVVAEDPLAAVRSEAARRARAARFGLCVKEDVELATLAAATLGGENDEGVGSQVAVHVRGPGYLPVRGVEWAERVVILDGWRDFRADEGR